jgi:hypothetical protein
MWIHAADHARLFPDNTPRGRDAAVIDADLNATPLPRTQRFILTTSLDDLPCLSHEMRSDGTLKPPIPEAFRQYCWPLAPEQSLCHRSTTGLNACLLNRVEARYRACSEMHARLRALLRERQERGAISHLLP